MAIALNKTTLKQQRDQAKTFKQFLPSLDLKRQQLLVALKQARHTHAGVEAEIQSLARELQPLYPLLGSTTIPNVIGRTPDEAAQILEEHVTVAEQADQHLLDRRWLQRIRDQHPRIELRRGGRQ